MVFTGVIALPDQSFQLSHTAGTMFELVEALKAAQRTLASKFSNPIGIDAGCSLFIEFVTLFPHDRPQAVISSLIPAIPAVDATLRALPISSKN